MLRERFVGRVFRVFKKKKRLFVLEEKKFVFTFDLSLLLLLLLLLLLSIREKPVERREMLTRSRKRKVVRDSLWDLIANNDDICFKHYSSEVEGTDINSCTR